MHLFTPFVEFLLPTLCMACEQVQTKLLCANCLAKITLNMLSRPPCCPTCGIPIATPESPCFSCVEHRPAYDETFYIDSYAGVLQTTLHAYKYQRRLACAAGFSYLWNHCAAKVTLQSSADYLLPVPLGVRKLTKRGFNQSWEIAKHIQLPKTVRKIPNALGRIDDETSQAQRNREMRKEMAQDLFYLNTDWSGRFKNQRIIVFDDVMTTGATMNAIASLLKNHGAKHVSAWVVLRTLPKSDPFAI